MALEEQMMMDFGEVPDNTVGVDPVSGNEIPLGSSAKEVRDDIPAQLSEGEMVIPADVVRFFGVKFFEDLRQAAKIGYAKMDADGRIGGEPIMEDESGLGLEMSDLEVMDTEGEPEEAFLGKFFSGIRESNRKQQEKNKQSVRDRFKAAEKRKSVDRVKNRTKKDKPKNRYEEIREQMRKAFRDDDDNRSRSKPSRPTVERSPTKPATLDFGFGGNPMERAARKYGGKAPQKKEAGQVEEAYTGENLRSDESFGQRFMKGLGYDEGGMAAQELSLPTPVEDPDVVQEGTTGGFGEEIGLDQGVFEGVMEAREYQNAAGHKIIIMFLDGVPMQDIPEGYYPVGSEPVPVDPGDRTSGGGSSDDDDDDDDAPKPTPINYKELTMAELTEMVKDQKSLKGDAIAGGISALNPLLGGAIKVAMWNQTRQVKKELERRRDDIYTSEVDKRRYDNLLEVANAEEPGLIATLLGKITGEDPKAEPERTPEQTKALMAQLEKMTKAYTPETKTPDTPEGGIDYGALGAEASKAAADIAFANNPAYSGYKAPGTEDDDDDDDKGPTIKPPAPTYTQPGSDPYAEPGRPTSSDDDDDEPYVPPTYSPDTTQDAFDNQSEAEDAMGRSVSTSSFSPTVRGSSRKEKDSQRRRDRQKSNKNIAGQSTRRKTGLTESATRGLSKKEKKGGAALDSRFGISGLAKGGLGSKKKK